MATQDTGVRTRDMVTDAQASAIHHFIQQQRELLAYYGVQATSHFVELFKPPMKAHVLQAGMGDPVVIIHGGDGEAVNWAPLMGPLQQQVRIFAVDRPGFGLSDAYDYQTVDLRTHAADFVTSLLDALELESATLIGGSMGGFFILAAALAHPERVRKIVLFGIAPGTTRDLGVRMHTLCGTPGLAEQFMRDRDNMEAQKSQYREMFHTNPSIVPDLYFETRIAGLRLPSEQGTWATLLPRIANLEGTRPEVYLGDELGSIQAPTLVLWGEHDMVPQEVGSEIVERLPNGRLKYLHGTGHFPFLEDPERCSKLITRFVYGQP